MKLVRILAGTILTGVLSASLSFADSTFEHKTFMGKEPAKVWTSGLKQRKEFSAPLIGKQTTITRVDKGVEWTLNTKKKTYTETPIALPYTPTPKSTGADKEPHDKEAGEKNEPACTPQATTLSTTRTIATLTATGHHFGCKESPKEGMTVWLAAPNAATKALQKDLKVFDAAFAKAQFANYPPKERTEIAKGMSMWARLLGDIPTMMGGEKLPDDLWVAMESESADSGRQTFYEVTSISAGTVPGDLFEIPAGYKKADASKSPFGGLGDLNLKDAMKELENFNSGK